ncbi:MAG: tyrosine recombinase XerC [Xanthomonadales bacterium]|nr:tyrosine recombinase XerC [Xanthomonadales bacterium]
MAGDAPARAPDPAQDRAADAAGFDARADVAAFLHDLAVVRRLSRHTQAAYRADLARLLDDRDIQRLGGWPDLQASHLRAIVARQHRAGLSGRSLARWLSAVRSFCRWLLREGRIPANPAAGLRAPKSPRKLPSVLDADAMGAFLEGIGAQDDSDPLLAARDRALFELTYSSGLRVSELVAVCWPDFDQDLTALRVTGKGGRTRIVPVGRKARQALADWRALQPGDGHVFPGRKGGPLSTRAVQLRIRQLGLRQGVQQRLHPHLLRHSCASHVLESSQDLRGVQELLGHADIATTQIYTHLDFQHLARVYDASHPRARRRAGPDDKAVADSAGDNDQDSSH